MNGNAAALAALAPGLLSAGAAAARAQVLGEAHGREAAWTRAHLASLPRRIGRELLSGGGSEVGAAVVDLGSFRACDLVAAELLLAAEPEWVTPGALTGLYFQGDAEERRMILKALPLLDGSGAARERLLEEAHRTNDQTIFEAGLLDSDLPAQVLPEAAWNRVVLKAAFLDLPVRRLFRWETRANPELSRMLLDFRREREAAGRQVWGDTGAVVAKSPAG